MTTDNEARAKGIEVSDTGLTVELVDGRMLTVPLEWYPRLVHATLEERCNWQLLGEGLFVHFPDLDEDLRIGGLLEGKRSLEGSESFEMWLRAKQEGRPLTLDKLREYEEERRKAKA
ncbi:MAG: DUF2442 domain-containing protein [Chloroflexota bacterium]|nr:DUF2442 domain-containing protein [Chloroflexota bacterium]MDE2969731.1 DUF2442 domain-containing protein [Chloroflexota bacterium]